MPNSAIPHNENDGYCQSAFEAGLPNALSRECALLQVSLHVPVWQCVNGTCGKVYLIKVHSTSPMWKASLHSYLSGTSLFLHRCCTMLAYRCIKCFRNDCSVEICGKVLQCNEKKKVADYFSVCIHRGLIHLSSPRMMSPRSMCPKYYFSRSRGMTTHIWLHVGFDLLLNHVIHWHITSDTGQRGNQKVRTALLPLLQSLCCADT